MWNNAYAAYTLHMAPIQVGSYVPRSKIRMKAGIVRIKKLHQQKQKAAVDNY